MSWKLAAIAPAFLVNACVYQLDSAIPAGGETKEPGLAGTWVSESDTAVVVSIPQGGYRVDYRDDDGHQMLFHARTGRLDARTILEITPVFGAAVDLADWPMARMLLVVEIEANELRTRSLSPDAFRAIMSGPTPTAIPHLRSGNDIILTAPTAELVPFLRSHLQRSDALESADTWRRVRTARSGVP